MPSSNQPVKKRIPLDFETRTLRSGAKPRTVPNPSSIPSERVIVSHSPIIPSSPVTPSRTPRTNLPVPRKLLELSQLKMNRNGNKRRLSSQSGLPLPKKIRKTGRSGSEINANGSEQRLPDTPVTPARSVPRSQETGRPDTPVTPARSVPRRQEPGLPDTPSTPALRVARQRPQEAKPQSQVTAEQNFDLTGLFPGDIDAFKTLISEPEQRIIRHVNSGHRKVMDEIKNRDSVTSEMAKSITSIQTNVSVLRTLTVQNSTAIARSNGKGSSKPKKTGKMSLEDDVETLNPTIAIEFQAVFDSLFLCQAAAFCTSSYMDFFHGTQDDVRMTARVLKVLLYGLDKKATMSEYKRGVGKQLANFRFKLAKNATLDALLITNQAFKERQQQALAELVRNGRGGVEMLAQENLSTGKPSWLAPDVLTSRIMKMARKQHDCVIPEWDPLPRSPTQRKALYICRAVYKSVIDMLRRSRDRSKQRLYSAGTFILKDWSGKKNFVDGHYIPEFRFLYPLVAPISPKDVEDCKTSSQEQHVQDNAATLKQCIQSRQEMMIEATYDVSVTSQSRGRTSGPGSRNQRSRASQSRDEDDNNDDSVTELREMKRHLSIIAIAVEFMEGYSQSPQESVLSSHPSMIRNIYRIALLLREVFIDQLQDSSHPPRAKLSSADNTANVGDATTRSATPIADEEPNGEDAMNSPQDEDEIRPSVAPNRRESRTTQSAIPEAVLKDIIPPDSEVDKAMKKLLHMSLDTFNKICVKNVSDEGSNQALDVLDDFGLDGLGSEAEEAEGMFDE